MYSPPSPSERHFSAVNRPKQNRLFHDDADLSRRVAATQGRSSSDQRGKFISEALVIIAIFAPATGDMGERVPSCRRVVRTAVLAFVSAQ